MTRLANPRGADLSRRSLLACMLFALTPVFARDRALARVDLNIASDGDALQFVPDHLACEAGAKVRLHFHHAGHISSDPHDWVLLKPGTAETFLNDMDRLPQGQVAPLRERPEVLAATPLCPRGQTVTVDFVAPPAGEYPFVCSVPGHGMTMRGTLTTVPRKR